MVLVTILAGLGRAQIATGDILLNIYAPSGPARIECFRPDGSHVWTTTGSTGTGWLGCSVTPQGRVVTTHRYPQVGVNVFDVNGAQISTFLTPELLGGTGDVSVFADGTLAVNDQSGQVRLYTQAGVALSTWQAGLVKAFGSYIDRHDQLFIADMGGPAGYLGQIKKLDRAGGVLATIPLMYRPGDLVVAPDDTLWVSGYEDCKARHYTASGTLLGEFTMDVFGFCAGLALASDGSLFSTGDTSSLIYHYSSAGVLLGTIPIPGVADSPAFLTIVECGVVPTPYCSAKVNSIGCVPVMSFVGAASASASSGFTVTASSVRNQKAGLLLYGVSGRAGLPFQGGFLCVQPPVRRSTGTNSGGTPLPISDCSGLYSIDMNAFAQGLLGGNPLLALKTPGTVVDSQWWGRDPGFPAPNNSTLSNGLEYSLCP
ncbi:MAG: hypothetical protein ABI054_00010 [Planctomycetota bacterium]